MIRPLRRRHRRMLSGLFLLLVIAAAAALTQPAPAAGVERLPPLLSLPAGRR
jgi:hypothetical protein